VSVEKDNYEGEITAVRGSVVDAAFQERLPPINSLIRAGKDGADLIWLGNGPTWALMSQERLRWIEFPSVIER